ncbi:MAG TPA: TonB-dependent receptor [Bryobacteraceae bacterium]|nr:TonB-dependent receptor [Bryobacteraceae bacterium]
MYFFRHVCVSGCVAILSACLLQAQFETATLTGVVLDPAGGLVPNATVKVSNVATNVEATALSDADGRYTFGALRPGSYQLTATAPGFKQYSSSGLVLQVAQSARVDVQLSVGAVSERVEVTAVTPVLETETAARGAVIDQTKIVGLPLNGRDYNQLALLSPGVLPPTPRLQSVGFRGAFNVNGNRAFNNAFQLDGVDNTSYSNSFRGLNVQVVQPSVEALQEFKIQTNAYSAEYGRSSGALINAVTRSGSNNLHGSLYEFHRNDDLDAANFFANRNGLQKPFRLRNQFGAAAGGRIVKDRTFFFADYEGLRDRAGVVRLSSVPNPIWRQGIFATPIHNPLNPGDTGQDFRIPAMPGCNDGNGNCWRIPENLIDPVGRRIMAVAPDPNTVSSTLDNNYVSVPVTRNNTNQFDVRLDQTLTEHVTVFGRYSFVDTALVQPAPRPGLAEGSTNDTFGTADLRSQGIAAGLTWVLTPTLLSETRFGHARGDYYQLPPNFGSGCPEQLVGLRGAPADESICGGLPVINFPGGTLRRLGRTTSVPQFQTPRSNNFRESLSMNKGAHSVRFGGEVLLVETGIRDVSSLLGNFDFSGRFTGVNARWENAIADLLLGFPSRYQQDSNTTFDIYQRMYFGYLQDDWKITRNLSLNVGIRYEFATPARERNLQWANFDPALGAYAQATEGSLRDQALVEPDRNNWAPRFGFSWAPLSKTVVRGGYGIFYNHSNRMGREGLLGFNPPFIVLRDLNIAGSNTLKATDAPFRLQDGIPAGLVDINRVDLATVARRAQDPYQRTSYVQQYNFGIQHEIAPALVLDVAYVGNRGLKLPAFRNLNPFGYSFNAQGAPVVGVRALNPVGLRGDIQYLENIGISNYNSLQARLERRFTQGLTFLASYTWGRALTDAVDHLSTSGVGNGVDVGAFREPQNPANRRAEYGPAEFDVTHRFVASGVWQVPFGRNWARTARLLFAEWEFSPIFTAQTGLALTANQPQIVNIGGERRSRPNRLADGNLPSDQRTVDRWFDTSAFVPTSATPGAVGFVPNTVFGNSGVGILRGPGYVNLDFNLAKNFPITERFTAQLRGEFFNALNHTNFGVPGVTTGAGFGQIVSAYDARIVQFALKLRF